MPYKVSFGKVKNTLGNCSAWTSSLDDFWLARLGALRRRTNFPSPHEQLQPISYIILHPVTIYVRFVFLNWALSLKTEDFVLLLDGDNYLKQEEFFVMNPIRQGPIGRRQDRRVTKREETYYVESNRALVDPQPRRVTSDVRPNYQAEFPTWRDFPGPTIQVHNTSRQMRTMSEIDRRRWLYRSRSTSDVRLNGCIFI
uniref:Uncharacterized protein n=1 Tax=Timema cristinae TaxID=61476 RepID=A0A7R9DF84_TIMCR|nr:unnamed protein product [Timema cristinae]